MEFWGFKQQNLQLQKEHILQYMCLLLKQLQVKLLSILLIIQISCLFSRVSANLSFPHHLKAPRFSLFSLQNNHPPRCQLVNSSSLGSCCFWMDWSHPLTFGFLNLFKKVNIFLKLLNTETFNQSDK